MTLSNRMRYNFNSMDNSLPSSSFPKRAKEQLGKRTAACEDDLFDTAPRAKKRFERVNSMLHDFSISNDKPLIIETSSDEDMADSDISSPSSPGIVEEPEDSTPSHIQLDHHLQGYLERAKQSHQLLPASLNVIRGNEVAVWRPLKSLNPFDDPTMSGRICELDEDGETTAAAGQEQLAGALGEVTTPITSDDEMSVETSPIYSPKITELSEEDASYQQSSCDSSDSMEF